MNIQLYVVIFILNELNEYDISSFLFKDKIDR